MSFDPNWRQCCQQWVVQSENLSREDKAWNFLPFLVSQPTVAAPIPHRQRRMRGMHHTETTSHQLAVCFFQVDTLNQFHQHFNHAFFLTKVLFLPKTYRQSLNVTKKSCEIIFRKKNMHVKCWWNRYLANRYLRRQNSERNIWTKMLTIVNATSNIDKVIIIMMFWDKDFTPEKEKSLL